MNKVILIGNLGKDPEMSYTPAGLAVTKFSLAVTHYERSSGGERQKETDWYSITAFGKLAETCNSYLKKGNKAYVEGRLSTRKYTDRSGVERTSLDVVLSEMENLTPRDPQQSSSAGGFVGGGVDDALGDLDDHPF
jgi:single-strand DNA-binding protein